jgi:glycosyltransferase involved in cell wall biosynthesis
MIEKEEIDIMKNWTDEGEPLLSVAVVAYNHENYISQALDGILMQETDFPFEIVVHDDCSTDSTVNILEEYAKKYPNIIKLILQKENQYSQGRLIETILFPKLLGKYIAICEGDDYWIDPHKLQIQLDEMHKIENCQISFHSAINKWEDKSKKDEITTKQADGNKLFTPSEMILGGGAFCPTASLILEKEAVENLPEWFDKAPFADLFLQFLGSLKGGALYIDRPMSVYRLQSVGSWTYNMVHDIEKKEKSFGKLLATLNEMDKYFNLQFHSEIIYRKSDIYHELALAYLLNNDFVKFKENINRSYDLAEKKSKKLLLAYYLRNLPIVLLVIIKLYKKLNKYLASRE